MKLALTFDDVYLVPKYSAVEHRELCNIGTKLKSTTDNYLYFDIPIISSPMATITEIEMLNAMAFLGGLGIHHRFVNFNNMLDDLKVLNMNIDKPTGAAIGLNSNAIDQVLELRKNDISVILIDVANGHHKRVGELLEKIRMETHGEDYVLMAGNVATKEGIQFLYDHGATAVRIGIGGGSLCETRLQTGVGIPMITSIMECNEWNEEHSNNPVSLIADGGIRYAGDIAKAIAAGADMVMLGSMLSGTKETQGKLIRIGTAPYEKLYKEYQGSASQAAKLNRGEENHHIEGNSTIVPYKGKVKRIIQSISDGLKSSMSYLGAYSLEQFKVRAEFVQVTQAGKVEALPHLISKD